MMKHESSFVIQARSQRTIRILGSLLAALFLLAGLPVLAQAETAPLRALLITGGGWHDYDGQKKILTEGISARANVEWTVDHEAGKQTDVKLSRFEQPGWAEGFDVVVYNMCFSHVTDPGYIEQIARSHHAGLPAVVIHCAMHSFRNADTEEWRKLLGVTTVRHEGHRPFEVKNLQPDHPIMKGFPGSWKTPQGELYMIEKTGPAATPLAQAYGQDTKKDHVCVWVNQHGKARVFGTTIGHHNETMAEETYLDLVSRGLLWAVNQLDDGGRPKTGFGAATGEQAAFVSIFNGKNLAGWDGKEQFWRVEDGVIIGQTTPENPTAGNTFLIWRDGEVDDFELKLKYRITTPWANSGIQFRSEDLGDHVVRGYQSDIATEGWISGILYEERGRRVFARRGQKVEAGDGSTPVKVLEEFADSEELGAKIHENDWNEYHIIARGNHISQKINGHLMAEMIDAGEKDSRRSGILAIQLHSGNPMTIQVKDIQLKRLQLTQGQKKVVPRRPTAP